MLSVGRISKLFGVDGGLMINLFDSFPDDFSIEEPLFVMIDSLAVPIFFEKFASRGTSGAVVQFADFDTVRRATELVGKELFIEHDVVESDDFYMEDLIGFSADVDELKGKVTDYIDSDHNPLLEVTIDGKAVLIPAIEEFIQFIDFEGKRIILTPPEGLVELQTEQ